MKRFVSLSMFLVISVLGLFCEVGADMESDVNAYLINNNKTVADVGFHIAPGSSYLSLPWWNGVLKSGAVVLTDGSNQITGDNFQDVVFTYKGLTDPTLQTILRNIQNDQTIDLFEYVYGSSINEVLRYYSFTVETAPFRGVSYKLVNGGTGDAAVYESEDGGSTWKLFRK